MVKHDSDADDNGDDNDDDNDNGDDAGDGDGDGDGDASLELFEEERCPSSPGSRSSISSPWSCESWQVDDIIFFFKFKFYI